MLTSKHSYNIYIMVSISNYSTFNFQLPLYLQILLSLKMYQWLKILAAELD